MRSSRFRDQLSQARGDGRPLSSVWYDSSELPRIQVFSMLDERGNMNFEVYADAAGKYRWRLKGGNGQIVASSGESFASKSNAERAAEGFKGSAKTATYTVFGSDKAWYWNAKASNGERDCFRRRVVRFGGQRSACS